MGSERLEAGTVLWAAGVAASPLGRSTGAQTDRAGRVAVDGTLRIRDNVFVLGDLSVAQGPDGRPLPGLAAVAMQQGAQTAKNIRRARAGQPLALFRYRD